MLMARVLARGASSIVVAAVSARGVWSACAMLSAIPSRAGRVIEVTAGASKRSEDRKRILIFERREVKECRDIRCCLPMMMYWVGCPTYILGCTSSLHERDMQ